MDHAAGTALVSRAQAGDAAAFAEFRTRFAAPVYDFLVHLLREPDRAAHVTGETFHAAITALPAVNPAADVTAWLFGIAHRLGIEASRAQPPSSDAVLATLDTPGASLAWRSATALDPGQYALLDLHLRQHLDAGGIAAVLGISKPNAAIALRRLLDVAGQRMSAFMLVEDGANGCGALAAALSGAGSPAPATPHAWAVVRRHTAACPACRARQGSCAPLPAFAALPALPPPATTGPVFDGRMALHWPPIASAALVAVTADAVGSDSPRSRETRPARRRVALAALSLGSLATLLGVLLVAPDSPLALTGDTPGSADPREILISLPATSPTATPTATVRPAFRIGASPGATTSAGGPGSPGTPVPTASAVSPDHTSTPGSSDSGGAGNVTVPPTPPPPPPATAIPTPVPPTPPPGSATACPAALAPNVGAISLVFEPGATSVGSAIRLQNNGCSSAPYTIAVEVGSAYLTLDASSGTVPAFGFVDIGVTASTAGLPWPHEGTFAGRIRLTHATGGTNIIATLSRPGAAPTISSASVCTVLSGESIVHHFTVAAEDDIALASVIVDYTADRPAQLALTGAGASWTGAVAHSSPAGGFTAVAYDASGKASAPFAFGLTGPCS